MNAEKNRRRQFFANKIHRDICLLVFLASLLPTIIVTICLYVLIFNITARQFAIPEIIAYNIIPAARQVTVILLSTAPACILVILIFAYKLTHKIVGPFDRVLRELNECMEGKRKGPIVIRKSDKFWPLVNSINVLLDKLDKI